MRKNKSKGYWTVENVFEESKKYTTRNEFKKESFSAYQTARRNNWLDEMSWLNNPNKKSHGYWTKEKVFEESKKYTSRKEFKQGSRGAFDVAYKSKWLEEMEWLNNSDQKPYGYWTKESIFEESKKYTYRTEFFRGSNRAYKIARENKWLDEMTWLMDCKTLNGDLVDCIYVYKFEEQKTIYVGRTINRTERDKQHRTIEKDSVKKFVESNGLEWVEMEVIEDNITLLEGIEREGYWIEYYRSEGWTLINKAKPGSIGAIGHGKWHYKSCKEEASKYKTRSEFRKRNSSAYTVSKKKGWLEEFFPTI